MRGFGVLTTTLVLILGVLPSLAQDTPVDQLDVRIVAAQGLAQYRTAEDQPWQPAKAGVEISTGAEFRTGPRSRIQFSVGDEHTITLDRLGVIKVLDAIEQDGKVYTEMGMKYGRSSYQVQLGGVEHESRIRTPSATLAVRGSRGFVQEYAGRTPMAGSDYGNVAFVNTNGVEVALAPETNVEGGQTSAAQQSLESGTFLPTLGAVTSEERAVVHQQPLFGAPSVGGVVQEVNGQKTSGMINTEIAHDNNPPPSGFTFGFLEIFVDFISNPTGNPVNVDISLGGIGDYTVNSSNGVQGFTHSGDVTHNGVSTGTAGESIISDGVSPLEFGTYQLNVANRSSTVTAQVQVNVSFATDPNTTGPVDEFINGQIFPLGPLQNQNINITVPESTFPQ